MIGEGPESGSAVGEGMGTAGVAQVAPGQQQAPDPNFSILGQPLAYDLPTTPTQARSEAHLPLLPAIVMPMLDSRESKHPSTSEDLPRRHWCLVLRP